MGLLTEDFLSDDSLLRLAFFLLFSFLNKTQQLNVRWCQFSLSNSRVKGGATSLKRPLFDEIILLSILSTFQKSCLLTPMYTVVPNKCQPYPVYHIPETIISFEHIWPTTNQTTFQRQNFNCKWMEW